MWGDHWQESQSGEILKEKLIFSFFSWISRFSKQIILSSIYKLRPMGVDGCLRTGAIQDNFVGFRLMTILTGQSHITKVNILLLWGQGRGAKYLTHSRFVSSSIFVFFYWNCRKVFLKDFVFYSVILSKVENILSDFSSLSAWYKDKFGRYSVNINHQWGTLGF